MWFSNPKKLEMVTPKITILVTLVRPGVTHGVVKFPGPALLRRINISLVFFLFSVKLHSAAHRETLSSSIETEALFEEGMRR
jgi:hypothetical protein